ncbi:MAG: hypothetical protein M1823_001190 [Watsoniomyces obsoletus]|nr:MAG: hypothetical protein M1823_001190 [Watsoniomyces obsoletus]
MPAPPQSRLDQRGLKERVAYSNMIQDRRDITPRFKLFVQTFREQCHRLWKSGPRGKKRDQELVHAMDGELQSRYDQVFGPAGFHQGLVELSARMMEWRFLLDYGDYLAVDLAKLRGPMMEDCQWKIDNMGWQEVWEQRKKEITAEKAYDKIPRYMRAPLPSTPIGDDLNKASVLLGVDRDQLEYEIEQYATRNRLCHSGIRQLVESSDFDTLAGRIVVDKWLLQKIYVSRPGDQLAMRKSIQTIQNDWFVFVKACVDGRGCIVGKVDYELTEKAKRQEKRQAARLQFASQQAVAKTIAKGDGVIIE